MGEFQLSTKEILQQNRGNMQQFSFSAMLLPFLMEIEVLSLLAPPLDPTDGLGLEADEALG